MLLIKIDKLSLEVDDDVINIYIYIVVCEVVNKVVEIMGLLFVYIFLIKNYVSELNLKIVLDILIMKVLKWCFEFVDDFMDE